VPNACAEATATRGQRRRKDQGCIRFIVHFFVCPKKRTKERALFRRDFYPEDSGYNHKELTEFSPGLQKFLTPILYYPAEKEVHSIDNCSAFMWRNVKIQEKSSAAIAAF